MAGLGFQEKKSRGRVEPKKVTEVRIVSAAKSGSVLTVTFNQPIVLKGTPAYTTSVAGATAVSAVATTLYAIAVTFSATIAAATTMTIPVADPAVRSKTGGFVADTTFPVT